MQIIKPLLEPKFLGAVFIPFWKKYFCSEFFTVTVKNPKNLTVSCHRAKKSVECYQGTPIQTLIKV